MLSGFLKHFETVFIFKTLTILRDIFSFLLSFTSTNQKKILQIQMQLQKYVQLIVEKQYGGYEVLISANRGALWSLFHH